MENLFIEKFKLQLNLKHIINGFNELKKFKIIK